MKKLLFSFGIACISVFMISCATTKKAMAPSSLNGEWNIVEIDGVNINSATQQQTPYVGFDVAGGRIYGNSGCNRMMGSLMIDSLRPGVLSFGAMASTRMACVDMEVEQKVLAAMEKVRSYEGTCETSTDLSCRISLHDENGNKIMVLQRRDAAEELNVAGLSGEWTIKSVNGHAIVKSENMPTEPFIGFNMDENRVYGNAGCNSINGGLKQDNSNSSSLEFVQVATTMMMCIDMDTERTVLDALGMVKSYRMLSDGTLGMYDGDGKEVMVLEKR